MKDELGQRMKDQYENRYRFLLPRRTYTILRLDGKAFHTYTRGLEKPFDQGLSEDIDNSIIAMISQLQGAVFAYTQSDEISILLTDFDKPSTDAWFDGNLQKMVSVSASIMTAEFNRCRLMRHNEPKPSDKNDKLDGYTLEWLFSCTRKDLSEFKLAYFDARAFTIPDRIEVMNYLIWRNQDCSRNSISMLAQSLFSHKELHGKSSAEMQEMMFQQKGVNWNDIGEANKNGRLIVKETYIVDFDPLGVSVMPDGSFSMILFI